MNQTYDYIKLEQEDDDKYEAILDKLGTLIEQDPICQTDREDCAALEELVSYLQVSDFSHRIIQDYVACLLTLSERQMELAYELGRKEAAEKQQLLP